MKISYRDVHGFIYVLVEDCFQVGDNLLNQSTSMIKKHLLLLK